MPVETDDDRRVFVHEDDWAGPVRWDHSGGVATFSAIFDEDYQLLGSAFVDAGAEGSSPQIHACSVDIPDGGAQDDSVIVNPGKPGARSFKVVEIKPDGTGMTVVRLQEI